MRILFFGTADFAVPTLQALLELDRHELLGVVTQPDRPQGRGQQLSLSPVKRAALAAGLPLHQPRRVRAASFLETARALQPDVLVLAAFGQIIPQALLDLPSQGPINVHGSLLPAYRGAAPIQHALLNGKSVTGITTMWMDATLDTGDMLLRREVPIDAEDTTGTLTPKLAIAGAELLLETLHCMEQGSCPRIPQDHSLATHAPAISPDDGRLRWDEAATRCRNRIRALSPRPGAYTFQRGKRVKLWGAHVVPGDGSPASPVGVVTAVTRDGVSVQTGEGTLILVDVQPENSRRMTAAEWARGARIAVGDRFDAV